MKWWLSLVWQTAGHPKYINKSTWGSSSCCSVEVETDESFESTWCGTELRVFGFFKEKHTQKILGTSHVWGPSQGLSHRSFYCSFTAASTHSGRDGSRDNTPRGDSHSTNKWLHANVYYYLIGSGVLGVKLVFSKKKSRISSTYPFTRVFIDKGGVKADPEKTGEAYRNLMINIKLCCWTNLQVNKKKRGSAFGPEGVRHLESNAVSGRPPVCI